MFERFTDRARKVMALANREAQNLNHAYIGPEHILIGLVREGCGVGANVLKEFVLDLGKVRVEIERLIKKEPDNTATVDKLPQTTRAKRVIEFAIQEARSLNHRYVGTEHLLLGLLREREGLAAVALANLGIKIEQARAEVISFLGVGAGQERLEVSQGPLPGRDLSSALVELVATFDPVTKMLAEKMAALAKDGAMTQMTGLSQEWARVATPKIDAVTELVRREAATSRLIVDALTRLGDQPITSGALVLAVIESDSSLARKLASIMDQLREICSSQ